MSEMKIDRERMLNTATYIEGQNDQMRDDFQRLTQEIRRLDGTWEGSASHRAVEGFMKIRSSYDHARQEAMGAYATYLRHAVGDYSDTEKKNVGLAGCLK